MTTARKEIENYSFSSPIIEFYKVKPQRYLKKNTKYGELPELTVLYTEYQKYISKELADTYVKKITERLDYLKDNLDEDQDFEIFNLSKNTVNSFIEYVKNTDLPLMSVDNAGNIIFEWRNYNLYDIVMILFNTNGTMSLTRIKENKSLLQASGELSEISNIFLQL